MKIKIPYHQWKQVKKELKLFRHPDKKNYQGKIKHSYTLPFNPPKLYPRYHFETKAQYRRDKLHEIELHIDWKRHIDSDGFHPLIEKMIGKIKKISGDI